MKNMQKIFIAAFIILTLFAGTLLAQEDIEKKKIEFLISSVESLKGQNLSETARSMTEKKPPNIYG